MRRNFYPSLEKRLFFSTKSLIAFLGISSLYACQKEKLSYEPLPSPIIESCEKKTWYKDADGDGYGNICLELQACEQPTGYIFDNMDCDDTLDTVNPGQTEVCDDGVDNDCDGTLNECELNGELYLSNADFTMIGASGDSSGWSVAGVGDVDGNGSNDFAIGAPWSVDNGGVYVVYSPLDENEFSYVKLSGVSPVDSIRGSRAGYAIAAAGDMNNDGFDDLLVGAPFVDTENRDNVGATYLVFGPVSEDLSLDNADSIWYGENEEDRAGSSVAGVGDVNEDGFDDMLIGAYEVDRTGEKAGAAYLFYGPASKGGSLSSADAILVGENAVDVAGWSVAGAQDTDGDGLADLLVGAYGHDAGGSLAGAAYLFRDSVEGEVSLATADAKFVGENEGDRAGYSLASGDIDSDGYADCIIGAVSESSGGTYAGATYVVLGPIKGELSLSEVSAKVLGEDYNDRSGFAIASSGDVNRDGYDDVFIGAPLVDVEKRENAGAAYLLYGPFEGVVDLATIMQTRFVGEDHHDIAGHSVAIAPDLNNDGFDDILVGAPSVDIEESLMFGAGATYVLYGGGI